MMKKCENCGKEFEPEKHNHSRQRFCCGDCRYKKYIQENKERIKEKYKLYNQKNREKNSLRNKKWYIKNREKHLQKTKESGRIYRKRPDIKRRTKERNKKYRQKNKERLKEYDKKYHQEHKKENSEYNRKYHKKNFKNIAKRKEKYRQIPRVKKRRKELQKKRSLIPEVQRRRRAYQKKRSLIPKHRINHCVSTSIGQSLKGKKNGRHWEHLVGYTLKDLMSHLEKQFEDWMTWENYGKVCKNKRRWNIDHIKPLSLFHFNSYEDEEFKECWALKNLQPMEAIENMEKGNRY